MNTRRWLIGAFVLGAVLVSGAGLAAPAVIKSPQQAVAEARPPTPSVVTAAVQRRVVGTTLVTRGTVVANRTIDIAPGHGVNRPIVTAAPPRVGQSVEPGQVVTEISGRPVIALSGPFPAYRDFLPGIRGKDVVQLQRALRAVGLVSHTGVYDASTQAVVERIYASRGYEPVRARGGVVFPRGEVAFVPHLPAQVINVNGDVGDEVRGPLIRLGSGELTVSAQISAQERRLVRVGQSAGLYSELDGASWRGRVAGVKQPKDQPGQDNGADSTEQAAVGDPEDLGFTVVIKGPFTTEQLGHDVRVTIVAASTGGKVLAVPVSAVYSVADGSTQVVKVKPNGREERVAVTAGASGDGFVEIRTAQVRLAVGDRVVVGR